MPDARKTFNIFEDAVPRNKAGDLASTPGQKFDVFSDQLASQPKPSTQTGADTQLSREVNESNTLFGDAKAETALGEIGAGLQSGVRQLASTPLGLGAIATNFVDPEVSDMLAEYSRQIAEGGAKRGIEKVEDLSINPISWARYAAGVTGEAIPFILAVGSGALTGRLLGNYLARKNVPLGTRKLLESTAPEALGAFGSASAIETAATMQELHQATGKVEPGASIAAGSAKGALESVFPLILSKQLGMSVGQGSGLFDRFLTAAANKGSSRLQRVGIGAGVEGATEMGQEEIDLITRSYMDENFAYLSPAANSRRINALAAGVVGGGVFSSLPGFNRDEAINEQNVRNSALDAPILFGAEYNELPATGPEDMVRNAHEGLDGTAGLATGVLQDQLLGEVDLRKRGLYAAAVPGRDTTFGTQDQANNDAGYYGVNGFVKLDPNKVRRGDVTASVEDIPSTVADPRVEFLNKDTAKDASNTLIEAIKLKDKARKERSVAKREDLLNQAAVVYRKAVDLGARVEPYVDGQVILRDESKVQRLAANQDAESIQPQITQATTWQTRKRANGQKFLVFMSGSRKNRKRPGGLALDLENVNPDDITALPTPELARSVLAQQAVSRRFSVSAAKGQGIRFREGTQDQQGLLKELVAVLTAMTATKKFASNKAPIVERFMDLVDKGLRVDVTPETPQFAMLREARDQELQDPAREIVGQEFTTAPGVKKLVKSRAKRTREPQVSRYVSFENKNVEELFYAQFHGSYLQEVVVGVLAGGKSTAQRYKQQSSPLINTLRDLVKSMRLKTDFVIEIVAPGNAGHSGIRYENTDVQLTPTGKPQKRTVIYIDPWKFGAPTQGGKGLIKQRTSTAYAEKGGNAYTIDEVTGANLKKKVNFNGKEVSLKDVPLEEGATHVLLRRNKKGKWFVEQQGDAATLQAAIPNAVPVHNLTEASTTAWLRGEQPEPPAKKGHKRFYHGGVPLAQQGGGPLWFTASRQDAEGWASRSPDMTVQYVDVPQGDPRLDWGDPDAGIIMPSRHELPAELAEQRKELGELVQPEAPRQQRSRRAAIADKLGVPEQKYYTSQEDLGRFWSDFSYNLGKIVIDFEWDALSAGQKDMIMTAWKRESFIQRSLSKQNAIARVVAHPLLDAALASRGRREQFYQFEEWVAQNIARVLADPDTKIGPVEAFFKSAGNIVERALLAVRNLMGKGKQPVDPRKGKPHEVVQEWVSRLYERGRANEDEGSFLSESTRASLLKSIQDNQEALGNANLEYAVATPQRASSVQLRKLLEILPPDAAEDAAKLKGLLAVSDRYNTVLEWGLGIQQLAQTNEHIESLQRYVSLTRAMENEGVSWGTMADMRLREVQALGRVQADALWKFMSELDAMTYLSQADLASGKVKPRWPTGEELLQLVRAHKLNKQAFEVYEKVRQDYLSFLSYLETVSVRNAQEYISDEGLLKERITTIQGEIAQMRARPYFPHMRFGQYAVTVKNNRGQVQFFATYDTEAQRTKAVEQIQKTFKVPQENRISEDVISPALQHYQGLPRFALQNVKDALGLTGEELTDGQKKDRDLLDAMAFDAAPITSFRQQLRERQRIPGFSLDGARSYANYFARSSKFVARLAYSGQLEQAIKDTRRSASPVSKDTRTRIADFMQRHYEAEMNPTTDLATLRSAAFSWYFAFVPSAAFVNLTQIPLVSWPYLSGKFGDLASTAQLSKAFGQNISDFWGRFAGKEVVDSPKQEAIDQAHDDRLVDDGFATELAAIANGSVLARTLPGSKVAKGVRHVAQWGAAPFAMAERTNRSVTFRAAYDLAIANPGHPFVEEVFVKNKAEADRLRIDRGWQEGQIKAYLVGAQAVRDTQFEYARWARPKLMQGGRGLLLMFKTYLQNMLYFMFKSDRGIKARFFLTLMAAAGIMGLPGAEDAEELVKWLGRKMGYNLNPRKELRKLLTQFTDQPDIFLHGASRVGFGVPALLQGLGVPSPTPDLSGSLSMGKLIPGLGAGLKPDNSRFTEMLGDVTQEVLGPAVGVPLSMYNALTDMSLPADDPKRWERALPRAIKGAVKSSRYLAEQRERDRTGGTVYQFDPNDWSDQLDAINAGLGFAPASVNRQWDYLMAQREAQGYWKGRRQVLMTEFWRARRQNDTEAAADALEDIKKYNKEVPMRSLGISRSQLVQSLKTRKRNLQLKEHQIPREKYLRPLAQETEQLYPEAQKPGDRNQIVQEQKVPSGR